MSAPTRGLSWLPAPVPGTPDRYSVEPRDSFDAAEQRYRLALSYDQACEVACLLDEAEAQQERDDLAEQLNDALDEVAGLQQTLTDTERERDDLKAELADVVEERDELAASLEDAEEEIRRGR